MTDKTPNNPQEEEIIPDTVETETSAEEVAEEAVEPTLEEQIDQLKAEIEREKNQYLFLQADFDNYRKRMLRERQELIRNAGEKVLEGVLPILDDFERGLQATKSDDPEAEAVRQGMEIIYNKMMKYLADNNVKPMESTGTPFDADFHEAIATIPAPSDDQKGIVIDTTQRGYMINDKVLRHAKVVVGE